MLDHFIIKTARLADTDKLVEFMRSTWRATYPDLCAEEPERVNKMFPRELIAQQLLSNNYLIVLLLNKESELIGYAKIQFIFNSNYRLNDKDSKTFLHQIYLREDSQRLGYGKYLLLHCYKESMRRDINQMFLQVVDNNKTALDFYCKYGFKLESKIKDLYPTLGPKLYYGYKMICEDIRAGIGLIENSIHYSDILETLKENEETDKPRAKL